MIKWDRILTLSLATLFDSSSHDDPACCLQENIRRFTRSPALSPSTSNGSSKDATRTSIDVHNPLPQGGYIQDSIAGTNGDKYVIVMVGLPARGKTYIGRRLARYLEFFHDAPTKVFNVGNYRRLKVGPSQPHSFFDHSNEEAMKLRNECASAAMVDLRAWLNEGKEVGRVAIYDATNSTKKRREWIINELVPSVLESRSHIIFIESVCDDETIIDHNITATKLSMPDYAHSSADEAIADFKSRISHYNAIYETLDDDKLSWIRLKNGGTQVTSNRIGGFLPGNSLSYVLYIHRASIVST
jgi:6-phosphofructo-2-kinase/fructose-2,6-biphosphatase 2